MPHASVHAVRSNSLTHSLFDIFSDVTHLSTLGMSLIVADDSTMKLSCTSPPSSTHVSRMPVLTVQSMGLHRRTTSQKYARLGMQIQRLAVLQALDPQGNPEWL